MIMPGVTKHIFNHEICDILSMFNCEIKTIEPLLPKEYSSGDIIALLKEFYPHEWHLYPGDSAVCHHSGVG